MARQAFHDASFMLRPADQQQVADILRDPEASENDKDVALQFRVTPTSRQRRSANLSGYRHRDYCW
ncbi:hypothetical protein ACNKHM_26370 [Shigella sonnei]